MDAPMLMSVVAVAVAIVQGFSLLCNICIVIGLLYSKQYRTGPSLLLLHLALCDVCLSMAVLIVTIPLCVKNFTSEDTSPCQSFGIFTHFLHGMKLWTITGMNLDTFSAICLPLSYNESLIKRRTVLWLVAVWVLTTLVMLVLPAVVGQTFRLQAGFCLPRSDLRVERLFGTIYNMSMLLLPALIISYFNVRILIIARRQRSRIVSAIISAVAINARLAVPRPELTENESPTRCRSALTTTLHVLVPLLVVYAPLIVLLLVRTVTSLDVDARLVFATHMLLCLSPLQTLLYASRDRSLRQVFKSVVRRQLYKSEMQLEIQSRSARGGTQRPSIATQLTMQLPKQLQRRLSGALMHACCSQHQRSKPRRVNTVQLRRQASELIWDDDRHQANVQSLQRTRSSEAIATFYSSCSSAASERYSPLEVRSQAGRFLLLPASSRRHHVPVAIPHNDGTATQVMETRFTNSPPTVYLDTNSSQYGQQAAVAIGASPQTSPPPSKEEHLAHNSLKTSNYSCLQNRSLHASVSLQIIGSAKKAFDLSRATYSNPVSSYSVCASNCV